MSFSTILTVLLGTAGAVYLCWMLRLKQQLKFIERYDFHPALRKRVGEKYPHLTDAQISLVFDGLRAYFQICHQAKRKIVAMPSQAVDVAWHEFILFTRAYERFSKKAIGRFLHHTPTEAMRTPTLAQTGIKRAWRLACAQENINPRTPERLLLLFAIDGQLGIKDGFQYALNCKEHSRKKGRGSAASYCAGHIACVSGCGGDSGWLGDATDSCDSSDGDSSCGGSSCGGD